MSLNDGDARAAYRNDVGRRAVERCDLLRLAVVIDRVQPRDRLVRAAAHNRRRGKPALGNADRGKPAVEVCKAQNIALRPDHAQKAAVTVEVQSAHRRVAEDKRYSVHEMHRLDGFVARAHQSSFALYLRHAPRRRLAQFFVLVGRRSYYVRVSAVAAASAVSRRDRGQQKYRRDKRGYYHV